MRHLYVLLAIVLLPAFAQVDVRQPAIAPSACAWPANVNTGVAYCPTNDPVSPLYVALNGGKFAPASQPAAQVTSLTCTTWSLVNGQPLTASGCTFK